jgi:hypothetical protein
VTIGDLVNKGFILNHPSDEPGRTFIVTGLHRSGTSLVASILHQAGVFIGSEFNSAIYEDEEITQVLAAKRLDVLQTIIGQRNATHARWGFKCPMLCETLGPHHLDLFDRPRLIITFRDPVAIAIRTSLSEYRQPMRTLHDTMIQQAELMDFLEKVECPSLLLSYEKALAFPQEIIDAILGFCDIALSAMLRDRLLSLVEPNRPQYIATARRRYEGLIEGIRDGKLYGWCWLTQTHDPVTLDVLVDDRFVMRVVADTFRQDLLDAHIGTGRHGFFIPVETLVANSDSVVRMWVAEYGIELNHSGKRLGDFGSSA